MDWANERWVKLYTRATPEVLSWPWQSRALMDAMLKIVDRSGQVGLGRSGVHGLALAVHLPVEVVTPGLTGLLEDGSVTDSNAGNGAGFGTLTIENFIEAQEAITSNSERQRRFKERRNLAKSLSMPVTRSNAQSRAVTNRVDEKESRQDQKLLSAGADTRVAGVVTLWNGTAHPDFGKVSKLNRTRERKIAEALKLLPEVDDWRKAIERLNLWPHAHGQSDSGWVAGFDYLLSNDKQGNSNLLALAEGSKGGPMRLAAAQSTQGFSNDRPASRIVTEAEIDQMLREEGKL